MRFVDLLGMSLNSLRRRKLRTALTVLGVVIGTASVVVMMSLGIGMKELNREMISSYGSLTAITVYGQDAWSDSSGSDKPLYLTDDVVKQFSGMEHVKSVFPLLEVNVIFIQGKYTMSTNLTGVPDDYLAEIPLGQGSFPKAGDKEMKLIFGNAVIRWFRDGKSNRWGYFDDGELPNVDLMGKPMFVVFDTDAYYQSQGTGEDRPKAPKKYLLKTAGVVEGEVNDYNEYAYSVYTQLESLKTELRKIFKKNPIPGQPTNKKGKPYNYFVYNSCIVNVDTMEHVSDVQKKLTDQGYQANSNAEWMNQAEQQSRMIQAVLGGIGAVSLFVAAIGIANTMMMSIYERTKEIGVIKVLGCDMGDIRNMFLIESGFIGFMGGVVGLAFSYAVSAMLNHVPALADLIGNGTGGNISRIPLWLAGSAVGFAILVGMLAGFFPAMRAMKLSPLAAIRNE